MIRAAQWLDGLDADALRALASTWGTAPEALALTMAMRGAEAGRIVRRACSGPGAREDLALLSANPFDEVEEDELVDPASLAAVGLVARRPDGSFDVNVDLALALAGSEPLEFGYAATLLARLSPPERATAARAMSIGPRPSWVDTVLDTAAEATSRDKVMVQLAHLRDTDRAVLHEALELGDLPDDLDELDLSAEPPRVSLDPGAAGQRGLVFRVDVPAAGLTDRPVIPLELAEHLQALLDQVPPPPEVVAAPARKRPSRTGPRKPRAARTEETLSDSSDALSISSTDARPVRGLDPRTRSGSMSVARDAFTGSATAMSWSGSYTGSREVVASGAFTTPYRLGRVTSLRSAGALVDLETAKVAQAALADPELAPDVMDVFDSLVVLHAGVEASTWAERCAVRLGL